MTELNKSEHAPTKRSIRVFISSTFRDMVAERDELMTHAWPELRRFCQERHVELVEVDLRWGIAEEQSTRKETLKLCLDEIRACRPFFIGLLGERYGWVPGEDAFTADLREEQPWLKDIKDKSVTEMEILHGVLNNPEMAGRAFFYFRDPKYVDTIPEDKRSDFTAENPESAKKQQELKDVISTACAAKNIPLCETYPDPVKLATLVLADVKSAIEAQFPIEDTPDPLTLEAQDHEAFAEIRRRTYIGRTDYIEALDKHAIGDGSPMVLLGDSGSGKSALLANWIEHWRKANPNDFIVQHYIGGTADSSDHWRLMTRVMSEIKQWSNDTDAVPTDHDNIRKDFPLWLAKARARAVHEGTRFILVLDALNQLDEQEHARLLGWLPEYPFSGPLRLIVSTLPGKPGVDDPMSVIKERGWQELCVQPLTVTERQQMIADYLARYGKKLDEHRLTRIANAAPAANPLYLKILLDDLRVTGTHDRLDERLNEYLTATDIPALLQLVLARYTRDYDRDRKELVAKVLGLIYASRRGLSETEILQLLRPADQPMLPPAIWTPLRSALEDSLIDRGGILNFTHDFLRTAVEAAFAPAEKSHKTLRLRLADYFETQPVTARTCDELPWLLKETGSNDRLRACLLNIDRFLLIQTCDEEELRNYWIEQLHEQQTMGKAYLKSFEPWSQEPDREKSYISFAANELATFLLGAALYADAEPLMRSALKIDKDSYGLDHPRVARDLTNLAGLLRATNRTNEAISLIERSLKINESSLGIDHPNTAISLAWLADAFQSTNRFSEAEPLLRRALKIDEDSYGLDHHFVALKLNNLAGLLKETNRLAEAEPLYRRALKIAEDTYGPDHPDVARDLNNLATLFYETNRLAEAEPFYRRALKIDEDSYGLDHPDVAGVLNNLTMLLMATNRFSDAEPLMRRALKIAEDSYGLDHPSVAIKLNNLAQFLKATNRLSEAEPLVHRALKINEDSYGPDHPNVATSLNNLAQLLQDTNRLAEAEPLMRRALKIDEDSFGPDHPKVATNLNNLAQLHKATNRLSEVEPLMRRALKIDEDSYGPDHPNVATSLNNLAQLLQDTNRLAEAEPLMRRALKIDEDSYGLDHPDVAMDLNNLAMLLKATNRFSDAVPLMRRALKIDENSYGPYHPDVARDLNNLSRLLQATNRLSEAEPLMRRSLDIMIESWGLQHSSTAIGMVNLGRLLFELGHEHETEAEKMIQNGLDIWLQRQMPDDQRLGKAYLTLGLIELRRQNRDVAREHLNEAFRLLNQANTIYPREIEEIKAVLQELE